MDGCTICHGYFNYLYVGICLFLLLQASVVQLRPTWLNKTSWLRDSSKKARSQIHHLIAVIDQMYTCLCTHLANSKWGVHTREFVCLFVLVHDQNVATCFKSIQSQCHWFRICFGYVQDGWAFGVPPEVSGGWRSNFWCTVIVPPRWPRTSPCTFSCFQKENCRPDGRELHEFRTTTVNIG